MNAINQKTGTKAKRSSFRLPFTSSL